MRLGIDFDNTLVSYEGLFHRVGQALGILPDDIPLHKTEIRSWLVSQGREHDFTRLQGAVYGPWLQYARAYPGARACLEYLRDMGVDLFLVSHKTRYALAGEPFDLHTAARSWLTANSFTPQIFAEDHVFLETSRESKLQRIAKLHCSHFVDDLPAVLTVPAFPETTQRLLFSPQQTSEESCLSFADWSDLQRYLSGEVHNA